MGWRGGGIMFATMEHGKPASPAQLERQRRTRSMLEDCSALIVDDHFVYASGHHGPGWIAKDVINMDPTRPYALGCMLAEAIEESGCAPDLICGPAIGGVISAQYTALALGVECVFADRVRIDDSEEFCLKRRYDEAVSGRRVLIVDDVINTGHSIKLVRSALEAAGGEVIAVAAWISRGNVGAKSFGVDTFVYLDEVHLPSHPAETCELCARSVPINKHYAHGADFIVRN